MEERISESEDTIEKINALIKENSKSNKFSSQNIQEIWDTIKKPNLRIIGIEEGEELQIKGPENIFNKIAFGGAQLIKKYKLVGTGGAVGRADLDGLPAHVRGKQLVDGVAQRHNADGQHDHHRDQPLLDIFVRQLDPFHVFGMGPVPVVSRCAPHA